VGAGVSVGAEAGELFGEGLGKPSSCCWAVDVDVKRAEGCSVGGVDIAGSLVDACSSCVCDWFRAAVAVAAAPAPARPRPRPRVPFGGIFAAVRDESAPCHRIDVLWQRVLRRST
jgi:hypothetical protein